MKNEPLPDELHELLWRGKLTAAELEKLRTRPETLAGVQLETWLSETLAKIPNASVPSNFTARVMQAVNLEESRAAHKWNFRWRFILPRAAVAACAVLLVGIAIQRHEIENHRAILAKNVALVAGAQPLPSVEALKNFDAIRRMGQPQPDVELLALLK